MKVVEISLLFNRQVVVVVGIRVQNVEISLLFNGQVVAVVGIGV